MKRKTTIKGLLLAALLMGGVSSAWGDPTTTTLYHRALTDADGATVWSASDVTAWGSVTKDDTNGLGITKSDKAGTQTGSYSLGELDGTAIMTYDFKWYVYAQYSNDYYAKLQIGNNIVFKVYGDGNMAVTANGIETERIASGKVDDAAVLDVHCVVNTVTKTITEFTIYNGETSKFTLSSLTDAQKQLNASSTFNSLTLEVKLANRREIQSRLRNVKVQQTTRGLTKYGYTLKYCTDTSSPATTTVKTVDMTAEENKVYNGTRIDAESPFTVSTTKYYATDDATTSFIINSDNKECIVKVRKADTWNWIMKGNCGGNLVDISNGTVTEGEEVSKTPFLNMLLHDRKLYMKNSIGDNFEVSFTPTSNNFVQTYDYTLQDYANVILLKEAESITTMTVPASNNYYLKERLSGCAGAYAKSDVVVCTLPAGTYKLSARVVKNGDSYVFFYGDDTTVLTAAQGTITTGSEFTLNASTEIKVKKNTKTSNSGDYCCLDYIFIEQTAVNVSHLPSYDRKVFQRESSTKSRFFKR